MNEQAVQAKLESIFIATDTNFITKVNETRIFRYGISDKAKDKNSTGDLSQYNNIGWLGKYMLNGWESLECFAYARYIFNTVFGMDFRTTDVYDKRIEVKCNKQDVINAFKKVKPGDVIDTIGGKTEHTVVVYSVDTDKEKFTTIECNWDKPYNNIKKYSDVSFADSSRFLNHTSVRIYHATNYEKITEPVSPSIIAPTNVTLSSTSISLVMGGTQQLTATVVPANATNKTVSWASSNTSVATVDATGKVTAKAAGSATITVTTTESAKKNTCTIMVTPPILSGLTASTGTDATQVKLSWSTLFGASYYKVYFKRGDGTKEGWDTTKVMTTSFTSPGNDTTQSFYTYTVYAINASGSEIANASIKYSMPSIGGLTAVKGSDATQVKLSWTAFSSASYYKVYFKRGDNTKEGWDTTKVTDTTFTSIGNDTKQSFYTYTVYAMNASGGTLASTSIKYNMPK